MIVCNATKKNGKLCQYRAKYNDKCGYHYENGYHKNKNKDRIHQQHSKPTVNNKDQSEVERILQTLIKLHNDLMVRIDIIASDVTCNSHKLNDLRRTLQPILGPLRVAVNTASWMPIVGRFVT